MTLNHAVNPLWKPSSFLLVALSLSIGWGIRGDFGHESGAWIPGALAAMAICLLSRREDWLERIPYCALFGALGWGFGGSISYMFPMSYADSGHWPSMWYGYSTLFFEGGLWAGLGAAGTILPLTMNRDRLTRMFVPFCVVLAAMVLNQFTMSYVADFFDRETAEAARAGVLDRHNSPIYWFDSDWMTALWALFAVCVYDLCTRKFQRFEMLLLLALIGAGGGWLIQSGLDQGGYTPAVVNTFVVPQGDLTAINPQTHLPYDPAKLLINWPNFFTKNPQHVGWWIGLILGIGIYFCLFGQWKNDSGLFLWMAGGWWVAFLLMPVLGSIFLRNYGGFRMTPPRGDNWAGTTGVLIGTCLYALRHGLGPVAYAGAMNFVLGGIGFSTVKIVRQMLMVPGNRELLLSTARGVGRPGTTPEQITTAQKIITDWEHYHNANWHSMLEQSHGFCHGLALTVTVGLLWNRLRPVDNEPRTRRWTEPTAVGLVLFFLTYANVFKNVAEWTKVEHQLVPTLMKAPLFRWIELSAATWFNLAWIAMTASCVALMFIHLRRRLAIVPATWMGKGQLIYVLLLWIMVIADFERSLNGFGEQRLVTEWVIIMNASLATFLAIALPGTPEPIAVREVAHYGVHVRRILITGVPVALLLMTAYAGLQYTQYGGVKLSTSHYRWGPEAQWRLKPNLKGEKHR